MNCPDHSTEVATCDRCAVVNLTAQVAALREVLCGQDCFEHADNCMAAAQDGYSCSRCKVGVENQRQRQAALASTAAAAKAWEAKVKREAHEEAAKVAESFGPRLMGDESGHTLAYQQKIRTAHAIAASIRALQEPKPEPTTVCPECGVKTGHSWCGRVGGPVTPEPIRALGEKKG